MILVRECRNRTERDAAMAIRWEVFVDEQNCPPEEERDAFDDTALHLIALDDRNPVGCARLVDKGDGIVKIGRVAVRQPWRGRRVGVALIDECLRLAREHGFTTAILDAQIHAIAFYERWNFVAEGPEFLDAGIVHRRMTLPLE